MSRTVDISKLPLLTGADIYQVWSEGIITYLRSQDVWRIVSEKYPCPEVSTDDKSKVAGPSHLSIRVTRSTAAAEEEPSLSDKEKELSKAEADKIAKKKAEWEELDEKAIGAICLSVSYAIRHEVIKIEISKELWDHLQKKYDVSADVQSFEGLQTAVYTQFGNCKGIQDYVSKLTASFDKLAASLKKDEILSESLKIQFLLCNLGDTWDSFLTSYLNSRFNKETTTFDEVVQILIQEEIRMKFNAAQSNLIKAKTGKQLAQEKKDNTKKKDNKSSSSKDSFRSPCKYCNKSGHSEDQCWKAYPEKYKEYKAKREAKKKSKDKADTAATVNNEFICIVRSVEEYGQITKDAQIFSEFGSDAWIIDSGATDYLIADPDNFIGDTVKPHRRGIRTATGHLTFSTLMGDVELFLKLPVGRRRLVLTDVLYVPEVKINLLGIVKMIRRGLGINFLPEEVIITYLEKNTAIGYGDLIQSQFILRTVAKELDYTDSIKSTVKLTKQVEFSEPMQSDGRSHETDDKAPTESVASVTKQQPLVGKARYAFQVRAVKTLRKDRVNLTTWHRRLAHLSIKNVIRLSKMAKGIDIEGLAIPRHACIPCRQANATKHVGKQAMSPATRRGQRVFIDTGGGQDNIEPGFERGEIYWLLFIDQFDRFTTVHFLKFKWEANKAIKEFEAVERNMGHNIESFHSDNAREFMSDDLKTWSKKKGIVWEPTAPYAHEQNGIVERLGRTLTTKVRAVLVDKPQIRKDLWTEVMRSIVFIKNISPIRNMAVTPFEMRHGRQPDLKSIRIIGSVCWVTIPTELRLSKGITKLDPRATRAIFLGYTSLGKQYVVYIPETSRIERVRDVTVDEGSDPELFGSPDDDYGKWIQPLPITHPAQNPNEIGSESESDISDSEPADPANQRDQTPDRPITGGQLPTPLTYADCDTEAVCQPGSHIANLVVDVPQQWQQTALKLMQAAFLYVASKSKDHSNLIEPSSFEEAIASPESEKWWQAMREEFDDHIKRKTWDLVDLPNGCRAIKGRWVFKAKINADNEVYRYKARWVAKGFSQTFGVDFFMNFSPTAKAASVRLFFVYAAQFGYECIQADAKLAFLQGEFQDGEVIYIEQPTGFDDKSGRVCKLNLPLYGLKQAARLWYVKLRERLASIGLIPTEVDECLFTNHGGTLLIVHVDDILTTGPDASVEGVKSQFHSLFDISDVSMASYYLGMKITRDRKNFTLKLTQDAYIKRVIEAFDPDSRKTLPIPMSPDAKIVKTDAEIDPQVRQRYQALLGSVMYLMLQTRPEMAYAVGKLLRYAHCPTNDLLSRALQLIRFLRSTPDHGILYKPVDDDNEPLVRLGKACGYTDADYAGCLDTRKSTTGYVFTLASGPISWSSKLQSTVSLSTCEAEYAAVSLAGREAKWIISVLEGIGFGGVRPMTLYTDSLPAIQLAQNTQFHARSKHIEITMHWIREAIHNGDIDLQYVSTEMNPADVFTKPLPKARFNQLTGKIGVC